MEELIIKNREFKSQLVELINSSKLPAFILKPIIKELYEQLNDLDKEQYNEALKLRLEQEEKSKKEEE